MLLAQIRYISLPEVGNIGPVSGCHNQTQQVCSFLRCYWLSSCTDLCQWWVTLGQSVVGIFSPSHSVLSWGTPDSAQVHISARGGQHWTSHWLALSAPAILFFTEVVLAQLRYIYLPEVGNIGPASIIHHQSQLFCSLLRCSWLSSGTYLCQRWATLDQSVEYIISPSFSVHS